jgi:hypothetical protein
MLVGPCDYWQISWLNFGLRMVFHMKRTSDTKKNELKPWKIVGWVIPAKENREFVAVMEKVLDVY